MPESILRTDLPFPVRRGKVRDVYDLGEALLIGATDRISAFDVVMPNGIPGKGEILTALSRFWFKRFERQVQHHLLDTEAERFLPPTLDLADHLRRRSMLVKKTTVVPIE